MRHITKGVEPISFRNWKLRGNDNWLPTWGDLANPEKRELKQQLLAQQGQLCCYCCRRVDLETSHIEHVAPRKSFPELALDYANLLACCMGERDDPPPSKCHCGCKKDSWYDPALFISPLDPVCENVFAYNAYGGISARDADPAATKTISKLNLDCRKLQRLRRAAIEPMVDDAQLTDEELDTLIVGLKQPDATGKLTEFYPALISVLASLRTEVP